MSEVKLGLSMTAEAEVIKAQPAAAAAGDEQPDGES